jgi:hypothetical protein
MFDQAHHVLSYSWLFTHILGTSQARWTVFVWLKAEFT